MKVMKNIKKIQNEVGRNNSKAQRKNKELLNKKAEEKQIQLGDLVMWITHKKKKEKRTKPADRICGAWEIMKHLLVLLLCGFSMAPAEATTSQLRPFYDCETAIMSRVATEPTEKQSTDVRGSEINHPRLMSPSKSLRRRGELLQYAKVWNGANAPTTLRSDGQQRL